MSMNWQVTERLLLREFEASDLEAVYAFRTDQNVMRYVTGKPETAEEAQAFLLRAEEYGRQSPQARFRFAIVLRAGNRVIGGCGLDITDADAREGEIGYHLLASCWGQGYATETAQALLQFGFDHLNLHRIFADCFARNGASARVMEKAGMRYEARLRQNRVTAEGWDDTLIYSLLEEEWRLKTVPYFLLLSERIGTAGQPDEDQFAAIRQAGYEVVINLRPLDACLFEERMLVEKEGMAYFAIPIAWEAPTAGDIAQFFAMMRANRDRRVFVHCALNMRVSACMYLYRVVEEQMEPVQAAIDLHRIWKPNPTWQALIDRVITASKEDREEA